MTELQPFLEFALDAIFQSGQVTLGYFQTNLEIERKADASPVTLADKNAEQLLRRLVEERFPDHGIIGEEFGEHASDAEWTWIIDPIDGTKSFISGVPLYGCLIALVRNRQPVLGVMHFPALKETIYAAKGQGCFWNGRRTRVSHVSSLSDAVLLASEINLFDRAQRRAQFDRLVAGTLFQRTWGDAYGYALVATGRADIMVDPIMKVWDCAPMQVILEEAGGTFTDWRGEPTIWASESVATNSKLYKDVLALLS